VGQQRVARFIWAVSRWLWTDATLVEVEANGRAGILIEREGAPFALLTVDASRDGIDRIFWVMCRDKLATILASTLPTER
jgi:RNA polymerase sigma-70 factor (ECF subfamily)